jgi:hypothetical protein
MADDLVKVGEGMKMPRWQAEKHNMLYTELDDNLKFFEVFDWAVVGAVALVAFVGAFFGSKLGKR